MLNAKSAAIAFQPNRVNMLATSTISETPNSGENPKTSCEAPEVLLVPVGELVGVLVIVVMATVFAGAVALLCVIAASVATNPSEAQPTMADDKSAANVALTVA